MADEERSPPALPPEADPAAPVPAARTKRAAPSKKAAAAKKAAATKKAAAAKKSAVTKRAAAAKKSAGVKAGAAKKAAPGKRATATKKAASPRARSTKPPVMPAAVIETPEPEIVSVSEPEQEPAPWAAADFVDETSEIDSESPATESLPPPPPPPPPPSAWGSPTSAAPPPPPAVPPPPPAPGLGQQWQQGAFPPPPAPEKKNRWLLPLLLGLAALAIVAGIVALVLILRDDDDSSVKSTAPATFPSTSEPSTAEPSTPAPSSGPTHLDALFDPVSGFTFVSAPEIGAAFRNQLEEVPTLGNVFDDSAARKVEADGQDVAVVVAVEFNPRIANNPGLASGFNAGATVGSESTEKVTIDGQEVTRFQRPDGTTGYVFVNGGIGVVVAGGTDPPTMEALVKGLIANANGAD